MLRLARVGRGLYSATLVRAGTGRQGHRRGRGRIGATAAFSASIALAMSTLLGACSTSPRSAAPAHHSVSVGDRSAETQEILAAWRAAHAAIDAASRRPGSITPALAATHTRAQLARVEANLKKMAAAGEVGVGPDGTVIWDRVLSRGSGWAIVEGCIAGSEVGVFAATGRPVPGPLGYKGPELVMARMAKTSSGWKLAAENIEEEKCPAG